MKPVPGVGSRTVDSAFPRLKKGMVLLFLGFISLVGVRCEQYTVPLNTPVIGGAKGSSSSPPAGGTLLKVTRGPALIKPAFQVAARPDAQTCAISAGAFESNILTAFSLDSNLSTTVLNRVPWEPRAAPLVAADTIGGCYVAGSALGSLGSSVSRFTPSGTIAWTVSIPPTSTTVNANLTAIATDYKNSVYAAGYLTGGTGFTPGWIRKYSVSGGVQYSQSFSSSTVNITPTALVADSYGDVFIAANYGTKTSVSQFNPTGGQNWSKLLTNFNSTAISLSDQLIVGVAGYRLVSSTYRGIIAQYDPYGTVVLAPTLWAYPDSARSFDETQPFLVMMNDDGTSFVAASVKAGGCIPSCPLKDEFPQRFPYVAKLDTSGKRIWEMGFQPSGAQDSRALSLEVNSAGEVVVSGISDGDKTTFQALIAP
ncbi:MAG: hypothetical protein HYX67_09965 [Candidatus Melainabacteria bacterium]|nr:hypothetical protein [Candidatus Melainabacteria bacterium]